MRPMPELEITIVDVDELVPYANNAKLHTSEQVDQIAASIEEFGNCDPLGVWHNAEGELVIVEGHGRYMALRKLGVTEVPVIRLDHLTDEQRRAYGLAHNKLTMNSDFDFELLQNELDMVVEIDMSEFGFEDLPTIDWDSVDEINADNYEKPESDKLRCPICGGVDEALRFVKVSE